MVELHAARIFSDSDSVFAGLYRRSRAVGTFEMSAMPITRAGAHLVAGEPRRCLLPSMRSWWPASGHARGGPATALGMSMALMWRLMMSRSALLKRAAADGEVFEFLCIQQRAIDVSCVRHVRAEIAIADGGIVHEFTTDVGTRTRSRSAINSHTRCVLFVGQLALESRDFPHRNNTPMRVSIGAMRSGRVSNLVALSTTCITW